MKKKEKTRHPRPPGEHPHSHAVLFSPPETHGIPPAWFFTHTDSDSDILDRKKKSPFIPPERLVYFFRHSYSEHPGTRKYYRWRPETHPQTASHWSTAPANQIRAPHRVSAKHEKENQRKTDSQACSRLGNYSLLLVEAPAASLSKLNNIYIYTYIVATLTLGSAHAPISLSYMFTDSQSHIPNYVLVRAHTRKCRSLEYKKGKQTTFSAGPEERHAPSASQLKKPCHTTCTFTKSFPCQHIYICSL